MATITHEERVYKLFQKKPTLSASQCWMLLYSKEPITSIRRSITDLTNKGKLQKTDRLIPGIYGKSEHVYEIISNQLKLF